MKKLLTILASIGLTATTGATVVACGTNGDNSKPSKPEIKLQVNSSTIQIEETTEILIENYAQIKNDLEKFSLNIINQNDEDKPILEQVGEFDSKAGKFTIKGLHKGTVNVIVMAYFRDKDLGINPISAVLTINVTTEVKFVSIRAEETELPVGDLAVIIVEEYQELKNKWEGFTLKLVNQDSNNKDEILRQYGDFDAKEGKFYAWGMSAGSVKVKISASLKEETKPENFSFHSETFEANEIIITIKKANFNGDIFDQEEETTSLGAGLTSQEVINLFNKRFDSPFMSLKYGEDFEFPDLKKEVKIGDTVKIKALKNSKYIEGEYTFKIIKYDINLLSREIKSISVDKSEEEIRSMIKAAFSEVIEKEFEIEIIEKKDYFISIPPKMIVGETIVVGFVRNSQHLVNSFVIDIVDK